MRYLRDQALRPVGKGEARRRAREGTPLEKEPLFAEFAFHKGSPGDKVLRLGDPTHVRRQPGHIAQAPRAPELNVSRQPISNVRVRIVLAQPCGQVVRHLRE